MGRQGTAERGTRVAQEETAVGTESPVSLLVCFSGKIGSGKTSISRGVASALGCRRTSFGGYLRGEVVRRGGDPDCRESLQDLGQSRIVQDAEAFCRDVLAAGGFGPGEDFVLDGVRHVDVLPHLVRIAAPSEVRLIFLEADAALRSGRVGERSDRAREDFYRADGHVVEADMADGLPEAADAIVDGSPCAQKVIGECMGLVDRWRWVGSRVASACRAPGAEGGTPRK